MLPSAPAPDDTRSGVREPSVTSRSPVPAEGDLGGAQALALDQPPLALGAAAERVEIDARQARVARGDLRERAPQRALALDAEPEELELEHAAVGRVAGDPAVELQAPPLLRHPPRPDLDRIARDLEALHHVDQRVAVLRDLGGEPLERRLERRAAVRATGAPGELEAAGRAGQVVVEVDGDQAHVHV